MSHTQETYTYRAGKKVNLKKQPDQFVVRVTPNEVEKEATVRDIEPVSPSSTRVTTRTTDLEDLMEKSRDIAPTHHAYYVSDTGNEFLITDRIFVTFRKVPSPEEIDSFANRYGLLMLEAYGDNEYLFQLTNDTGMNPVKLVVKLTEKEPTIESVEHDLNYRMKKSQRRLEPDDSFYSQQWHLHTQLEDPQFDRRASTRCDEAWKILGNYGSKDVVIGITDDGCNLDHTDFKSEDKFAGWGYFNNSDYKLTTSLSMNADRGKMYESSHNHGTSCAGVSAAVVDKKLTVGAAPGCSLLPIKWPSEGRSLLVNDRRMINLLEYISDKVDILSCSWSSSEPNTYWPPQIVKRISKLARIGGRRKRGILFLWSAGNENCPIQHSASVEVPHTHGWLCTRMNDTEDECLDWEWIGVKKSPQFSNVLVGTPGVMHVAAISSTAQRSHYSNYGTGISICAPSDNGHTYGRLTLKGLGITTAENNSVTSTFGGTSSATPLVAGIAALVISANPDLTALEVISILKRTASKDLNFEGYPKTPPSSYNPDTSWDVSPIAPFDNGNFQDIGDVDGTWSPWFGFGKVDAFEAVSEALRIGRRH